MQPTRFTQAQRPSRRTDQDSRQGTEIRFMTDQKNTAFLEGEQGLWIPAWHEPIRDFRERCQASPVGQPGGLESADVGTADQSFCADPELGQMVDHSFCALPPPQRERTIRVIPTIHALLSDAMAEQKQINPG